mmetsp:Transcript_20283/g.50491  ORF Transcript_20283/g.50491 Transcript_20283/m.50491 type:complete len:207 (+) Transcript_20283:2073-2693(+)
MEPPHLVCVGAVDERASKDKDICTCRASGVHRSRRGSDRVRGTARHNLARERGGHVDEHRLGRRARHHDRHVDDTGALEQHRDGVIGAPHGLGHDRSALDRKNDVQQPSRGVMHRRHRVSVLVCGGDEELDGYASLRGVDALPDDVGRICCHATLVYPYLGRYAVKWVRASEAKRQFRNACDGGHDAQHVDISVDAAVAICPVPDR